MFRYGWLCTAEKCRWFAILLAQTLDHQAVVPGYIRDAVLFAHGPFSRPLIMRILRHRMNCLLRIDSAARSRLTAFNAEVDRFGRAEIDLPTLRAAAATALPGDVVHPFLDGMT